jgi:hypothetical protein
MTSEGNVADTGILEEAYQLINQGAATSICDALEILMQNARCTTDTDRMKKIKATQKVKGCRRHRRL